MKLHTTYIPSKREHIDLIMPSKPLVKLYGAIGIFLKGKARYAHTHMIHEETEKDLDANRRRPT